MEGVEVNPQFWRGKQVFVTGHTGFKGSWLSILLQSFGAEVVGFSLPPPTQPNLFTLAGVEHGMQSIVGHERDLSHAGKALIQTHDDIIIHMVTKYPVPHSYASRRG